ncbi:MAG TPA: chemotaxis protein CheW [Terriglobales bacterium]|nr:chemotaxis protein CheW [Terriglobales bacterium]
MNATETNTGASIAGPGPGELLQLVSFHVGEEEFGLDILRVQEIIRIQPLTRVPNLPDYIDGVFNLRGKVIPVIALRKRLGIEQQAADKQTRIVVVDVHDETLGFVVDSVSEVLRIHTGTVEPAPRLGKNERNYISGVSKLESRLLLLIDLEELMSGTEFEPQVQ